jgi:hypothetical protein
MKRRRGGETRRLGDEETEGLKEVEKLSSFTSL